MTVVCNGLCKQFRTKHNTRGVYSNGLKYCSICCCYVNGDTRRCRCCNSLLRTVARNRKSRAKHKVQNA
jgi:hypothetical protein